MESSGPVQACNRITVPFTAVVTFYGSKLLRGVTNRLCKPDDSSMRDVNGCRSVLSFRKGDDCRFTVPAVHVQRARPLTPGTWDMI